jgi:hypothetical protein
MMRLAVLMVLVACRSEPPEPPREPPPPPPIAAPTPSPSDAAMRDFNRVVLDVVESYQPGGGYAWPAPPGTHGTHRDLRLGDERIARGSGGPTHCSGLTFEVLWRAFERWPGGIGLSPAAARALMRTWFVPLDGGHGPAEALPAHGLGRRIERLEDARPGDFVQVWMNNGGGHTLVFLSWTRDADGRIVGVRHFSSHPATDGIGTTERAIGTGRTDIDPNAIHIARAEPAQ